ncbi:hypothetical protein [Nonomuraea rubra]
MDTTFPERATAGQLIFGDVLSLGAPPFPPPGLVHYLDERPAGRPPGETVVLLHGERMAERIPGAKGEPHVTLAGAGHFPQEDQPRRPAETIANFFGTTP